MQEGLSQAQGRIGREEGRKEQGDLDSSTEISAATNSMDRRFNRARHSCLLGQAAQPRARILLVSGVDL